MISIVHGLFSVICYVMFIMIYMNIFFVRRKISKAHKCIYYVSMVTIIFLLTIFVYSNLILKEIGIILTFAILLWRLYEAPYLKILALTFFFICGCIVADYAILILIMLIMPEGSNALLASTMGSSLVEVFSECVHLLIVVILVRCFKKQDSKLLSTIEWLRFAIVPVCTLGIIMGLMAEFDLAKEQQQEAIFLLIAIGLVIMNIIIYFLLNDIIKREAILRRNQISTERTKNEIKRYENLSENYEKQRKLQHEYNHRLNSIAALARNGQIEELKEYLHRLNYEVGELNRVYDFKNTMLNALLNAKEHEMHRKGITFIIFSMNLDNLPIYNEDLVVILENLLNNAMEACEECEDKVVKLKITEDDRGTLLAVENTYVTAPIRVGDKFITTKNENRDFHGIGIENVKDVVEKYHGETMINVFEDVFRFTIRLPQIAED